MTCAECGQPHTRGASAFGRASIYCSKRCANRATQRRRTARARLVIRVADDPELTPWAQIGAAIGVSGRRAEQIAARALQKMKEAL